MEWESAQRYIFSGPKQNQNRIPGILQNSHHIGKHNSNDKASFVELSIYITYWIFFLQSIWILKIVSLIFALPTRKR